MPYWFRGNYGGHVCFDLPVERIAFTCSHKSFLIQVSSKANIVIESKICPCLVELYFLDTVRINYAAAKVPPLPLRKMASEERTFTDLLYIEH